MIERVVHPYNLQKAVEQVISNKGSAGVDGIKTSQLKTLFPKRKDQLLEAISHSGRGNPQRRGQNPTLGSSHHHRPSIATSRLAGYRTVI